MNIQIGDFIYLLNSQKLPPIFQNDRPHKVWGVLKCPFCGQTKVAILSDAKTLHFLNAKRFAPPEETLNIAIQKQDYEMAAMLRDERVSHGTPT